MAGTADELRGIGQFAGRSLRRRKGCLLFVQRLAFIRALLPSSRCIPGPRVIFAFIAAVSAAAPANASLPPSASMRSACASVSSSPAAIFFARNLRSASSLLLVIAPKGGRRTRAWSTLAASPRLARRRRGLASSAKAEDHAAPTAHQRRYTGRWTTAPPGCAMVFFGGAVA